MKRQLLLFTVFIVTNLVAWAQSGTCGDNVKWNYSSGTLTISGTGLMEDYVSSESVPWYSYSSSKDYTKLISKVVIKDGVTRIGNNAFGKCTNLLTVNIANTVTSIGNNAFRGCGQLYSIFIPNSVTSIGDNTFGLCKSLGSIEVASYNPIYDSREKCNAIIETATNTLVRGCKNTIVPNSVTTIGNYAFYWSSGLTSIEMPNSVTSIEGNAFESCPDLTSVVLNEGVISIGVHAFNGCVALSSITFPNSLKSIEYRAFYNCRSLASVAIPDSVETIGEQAFDGCSGLKSVSIGNSVKSIGNGAFWHCSALTSITIGNSITNFDLSVFSNRNLLQSIVVSPGNPAYDSRENCNAIISSVTNTLILGCVNTTIPNSVTAIGNSAFSGALTTITIPNSVTSIGSYAFFGCSGLTSIALPEKLESVDSYAFYGCSGLTSITIPSSVTNIGNNAFEGCKGLRSISIPNLVTVINDKTFSGCNGLTSVEIPNSVTAIGESAFQGCEELKSITIPSSVRNIGRYAFKDCKALKFVTINNSSTYINYGAFEGTQWNGGESETSDYVIYKGTVACGFDETMPSGTSVVLRKGTTEIASKAFQGCSQLSSISIPNTVNAIGDFAFSDCSSLASITIPSSVTSIKNYVFTGCTALTSITVESDNPVYDSREECNALIETASNTLIKGCKNTIIPNSVTHIGGYAFSGCKELTSLIIPSSVTSIGNGAFYDCRNLKDLTIPNSITSVGADVFRYEYGENGAYLDYIPWFKNLPDGLVYIGKVAYKYKGAMPENTSIVLKDGTVRIANNAFYGCTTLSSVTIPNTVIHIQSSSFRGCTGLTSVAIPNSVIQIWDYAFEGCTGLTSVTFPNSVTEIGYFSFGGCTGLTSVTIPNSIKLVQSRAFNGCSNLSSVTIENPNCVIGEGAFEGTKWYANQSDTYGYVIYEGTIACGYDNSMPSGISIELREGTTGIANDAFENCENMVSITIPNSVRSIGNSAFSGCSNLASVTIPNSVNSIGNYAFSGCNNLTSIIFHCTIIGSWFSDKQSIKEVVIGKEVTNIASDAFSYSKNSITSVTLQCPVIEPWFSNFSSISEVILEEGVEEIGDLAFKGCESLITITIPNSVKSIGAAAFLGCSSLTSISIPNTITNIGNRAFAGCYSLKSVLIPGSISCIEEHTFNGCRSLGSIILPQSVKNIGDYAFFNCDGLEFILSMPNTPPSSPSTSVANTIPILLSNNALSSYKEAETWRDMKYMTFETDPTFLRADTESLRGTSCKIKFYPIDKDHNFGEKDNGEEYIATGLDPETTHAEVTIEWKTKDGNFGTAILDIQTSAFAIETAEPKALSTTKARLIASANEYDDMTHFGFEWRRIDAPDMIASSKVSAPLYNGTIVGTLNNLKDDVYYKYRPFYKSDSGEMYYGEWVGLFTGDANVYFEPEVYTKDAEDITKVSALLAGVWFEGTDDIQEKGFEYWAISNATTRAVGADVKKVTVSGNTLTTTLDGLKAGATYGFRSYAKTASGTTYGEEKTFKTKLIGDVDGDGELTKADAKAIADHIVGNTPAGFNKKMADMNDDKVIDATDIVLLVNLIK